MTNTTFTAKDAIKLADAYHAQKQQERIEEAQAWVNTNAIPRIIDASQTGDYRVRVQAPRCSLYLPIIKDILGEAGFAVQSECNWITISWSKD